MTATQSPDPPATAPASQRDRLPTGRSGARMSNYSALAVGAIFYQAPPSPFTIWFDDLAIDDSQIGCQ